MTRRAGRQIGVEDPSSWRPYARLVTRARAAGEVMDQLRVDADQAYNTSRAVGNDAVELREELARAAA